MTALLLFGLAVTLLACSDDDPVPLTGYFVGSPAHGVTCETDTQSGTTGADGAFLYLEGEVIIFSVA